jgi:hypothetical protein
VLPGRARKKIVLKLIGWTDDEIDKNWDEWTSSEKYSTAQNDNFNERGDSKQ